MTDTAKHTPGPWEQSDWMESFVSVTHGGLVVAEVQPKLWNGKPNLTRAEVKANARLIAAAPDLLKALLVADELLGCTVAEDEADKPAFKQDRATIRAAIAKATGVNHA